MELFYSYFYCSIYNLFVVFFVKFRYEIFIDSIFVIDYYEEDEGLGVDFFFIGFYVFVRMEGDIDK